MPEKLLSYKEVSERLGLAPVTLRRWVSTGVIGYVKLGRAVRFRPDEIDAWIKEHEVSARIRA